MSASVRAQQRWGLASTPPTCEPDYTLEIWADKDGVNWVALAGEHPIHDEAEAGHVKLLLDAAWTWCSFSDRAKEKPNERPAAIYAITFGGIHTRIWNTELVTGTGWSHAVWLLRQYRWVSWKFLSMAWRALRGRG